MLNRYINHVRNREYMSGVERDKLRIKQTAEVFTPTPLVQEMLDKLEKENLTLFSDPTKTFLDNSCGDGQFLSEVVIRKMERSGCTLEQALSTTYGVEFMEDNVVECIRRLAGPEPTIEIMDILSRNIVCYDALKYDYSFGVKIKTKKKRTPKKKKTIIQVTELPLNVKMIELPHQ
jgi:hypothetical protein